MGVRIKRGMAMKLSERIPPHINIRNEGCTGWISAREEVAQLETENAALIEKVGRLQIYMEIVDYIDTMALFIAAGELPTTAATRAQHLRVIARNIGALLRSE